jgi:uncharacterized membrane protein YbhN (UPF0104 family)
MDDAATHRRRLARRLLITAVKLGIIGLVVWGVHQSLQAGLRDLGDTARQLQPRWLVVSGVLYLVSVLPPALFWHRLLIVYGQRVTLWHAVRAYYIGHLGKYVPGKAMVVVLRAGLVRGEHVSASLAAVAVFVETLAMMAVGSFLAAVILALWFRDQWQYVALAVGFMVVVVVPTLPPVARWLLRLVRGRVKWGPLANLERLEQLDFATLVLGWSGLALAWVLAGLSLWAAVQALDPQAPGPLAGLPFYTAAVAVSVVGGFLSLVPAGAVVRDVLLAKLLTTQLTEAVALGAAILLRLVWLVAEALAAGILYFIQPKRSLPAAERADALPTAPANVSAD